MKGIGVVLFTHSGVLMCNLPVLLHRSWQLPGWFVSKIYFETRRSPGVASSQHGWMYYYDGIYSSIWHIEKRVKDVWSGTHKDAQVLFSSHHFKFINEASKAVNYSGPIFPVGHKTGRNCPIDLLKACNSIETSKSTRQFERKITSAWASQSLKSLIKNYLDLIQRLFRKEQMVLG